MNHSSSAICALKARVKAPTDFEQTDVSSTSDEPRAAAVLLDLLMTVCTLHIDRIDCIDGRAGGVGAKNLNSRII
jgi:hypothetical protein